MKEVLIYCEGSSSREMMMALGPFLAGSATLELRPRSMRVRSPVIDPNVLAGIIQASAEVLAVFIAGLIAYCSRPRDEAPRPGRSIRISGEDGVTIDVPLDADPERVAAAVELVRRSERPRILLP
ncbi:MAG TPA: hypothetical protein VF584_24195 [Longimicrobium sp.]|jgi:hypothetical protein